jgi:hypothetical protein
MNFDDTARYFGDSRKLWPEEFTNRTSTPRPIGSTGLFQASNGRLVPLKGRWKVLPQAWWPELPGKTGEYISADYSTRRKCRDCRKVFVDGIRRYCERCALKRKLASTRESKRAK